MSVLDVVQAAVVLAALVALVRWVMVRRAVRDVTTQLRRRRVEGTCIPVHLALVDSAMQDLAIEVNATIASSQAAVAARRRQEERYRELMAELSHDLRTPLTAVRGYQQMLLASGLPPAQHEQLRTAARHADALAILIDEVFEYAWLADVAPEDGAGQRARVDLVEELGQCLVGMAGALAQAGLEVEVEAPDVVMVETDPAALRRVLANLVRNAAQHGCGRLDAELEADAGQVVLKMRNGVRRPQALDITRVLERRWSSDPAGTGLGLSIVALLVERMSGSLSVGAADGDFEVEVRLGSASTPPERVPRG